MKFVIYHFSNATEQEILPVKNLLVLEKGSKERKLHTQHRKMKGILTVSAEVFMSLPNHMNVNMYLILSTYHPILKRSCLRQNKFLYFLCWINIY